ncbi:MAG: carbohydrate binding family 9 domain-containing protein [Gemmatimonadota bacterium]|nr:carbohydrate binding family 9 domain-containing protein [Gemmatimonadota bacterium]
MIRQLQNGVPFRAVGLAHRAALGLLTILPLFASAIFGAPVSAQQTRAATATPIAGSTPQIDGRLNDRVWADAPALTGLVQREPQEGRPVSQRTEVRILTDAEALYVGAWLFDEDPSSIVLGQTLRDASLNDSDAFSLVLDTYLDRQNGFVFATTPAGIEYDGQVTNEGEGGGRGGGGRQQAGSGGGFNLNWDGSWEVATTTDGEGWYAEMRIPFSTLRYDRGGAQTWGFNFERSIRRNNEVAVWAPLPRQFSINRVSLAGTLSLDAPTKRIVTVSPYVLADAFKDYTVVEPDGELDAKVGGDAKVGLTQSLTLDLTVNTDFAQAEVDDQQVNLTRFSLFFPEKRAFFLENAGTFSVGSGRSAELFFSRRIGLSAGQEVPIQGGARLTGRAGGFQIGLLSIQTDDLSVFDELSGAPELVSPANNFGVVRGFREFSGRSRIGAIFVSRLNTSNTDDYNLTYGLDGRLGIGQDLTFDGWFGLTETDGTSAASDAGFNDGEYGFNGGVQYVTRDWQATAGYRQIGGAFNPEVGFLNRSEYRHVNTRILRHFRVPSVSWFREFRPHVSWSQFWSLDGFSETYLVHIDNHFAFENGAFFQLPGFNFTGEGLREPFEIRPGIVIPAGNYDNHDWEFRANTDRSAPLSFSAGWDYGGFFSGTRFGPNATVAYRYGNVLATSLQVNYFDVRLDEGEFETAVVNLNASYSFTPRLYAQANLQYNDDTENLGTNIRIGWLDTAGTGLFIVYNDTEHLGRFVDTGVPAGPRQRQFVVKYTKLFDLAR